MILEGEVMKRPAVPSDCKVQLILGQELKCVLNSGKYGKSL